jgi:NO-binding membrane sensor protein with MHYT domain/nitrate/nitrite-specific signal transduction histidine kinase
VINTYDWRLVILSILIAIITSYTALDLGGRVTAAQSRLRRAWLIGGAVTMGVGIWSMHFIAMLAFSLPIPIAYHVPTVLASLLVAIIASGIALFVVSRHEMKRAQLLAGGVFLGLGITSMHYLGMAAMRMPAATHYTASLVCLSVAVAICASLVALRLTFQLRTETAVVGSWKVSSAVVMGGAIAGMHYTAMAAVTFAPLSMSQVVWGTAVDPPLLGGVAIAVATLLVLSLTLLTSLVDRRFAVALHQSEQRFRSLYETGQALVSNLELEPLLQNITHTARELLNAGTCGLLVHGEDPDVYEYVKVSGWPHKLDRLLEGRELLSTPYKKGICLRVEDITKAPWFVESASADLSLKAFLGAPLLIKGRALGTLFVGRGGQDRSFSKEDEDLLLAFANEAAIALENARLYERQRRNLARLHELSRELSHAQEHRLLTEERNRIAQELHDQVAQVLFSIGLKANSCLEQLNPTSEIYPALQMIKTAAGESTVRIREAIYRLSSPVEREGQLLNYLRTLVREFKEATTIDSDLVIAGGPYPLPKEVEETLCRVAKEALTNVAKHSKAKVAVVSLRLSPHEVSLTIQDDGVGLPRHTIDTYWESVTHFGLKGMRRQIESLGGYLQLKNGEETGLIVTATVLRNGAG